MLLKHCSTVVHNQSLLWWGSLNGWSREPHLLEFKSSTLIVGASDNHEDFHFRCCPASTLSAALACGSTLPGNLDNNSIDIISLYNNHHANSTNNIDHLHLLHYPPNPNNPITQFLLDALLPGLRLPLHTAASRGLSNHLHPHSYPHHCQHPP